VCLPTYNVEEEEVSNELEEAGQPGAELSLQARHVGGQQVQAAHTRTNVQKQPAPST
jgi:hypothetical protein